MLRLYSFRRRRTRLKQIVVGLVTAAVISTRDRTIWKKVRSDDWWNSIALGTFTDDQWRENFRMSKASFDLLCNKLTHRLQRQATVRPCLSVERQVEVTLYFLAGTAEYRTIGNLFGIAKSTVCVCVKEVCRAIVDEMFPVYVKFPDGYQTKWGFLNCGGAIDGTHIPIIAPSEHHADYVNRKVWYSVILQGVCDHRYLFTDVYIGWIGRVHDARVLSNSPIYQVGEEGLLFNKRSVLVGAVEVPVVLLADPAYPLKQWLQKPFSDRANLSPEEINYNYREITPEQK